MRRRQILAQKQEEKKEAAKPAAFLLVDGEPCPCCKRIYRKRGRKKS